MFKKIKDVNYKNYKRVDKYIYMAWGNKINYTKWVNIFKCLFKDSII